MMATVREYAGSHSDALHLWSAPKLQGPWTPHRRNPCWSTSARRVPRTRRAPRRQADPACAGLPRRLRRGSGSCNDHAARRGCLRATRRRHDPAGRPLAGASPAYAQPCGPARMHRRFGEFLEARGALATRDVFQRDQARRDKPRHGAGSRSAASRRHSTGTGERFFKQFFDLKKDSGDCHD